MEKVKTGHLTIKGQITLPKALRDALGWKRDTPLTFIQEKDGIKIIAAPENPDIGKSFVARFTGVADMQLTTDEVMVLTRGEDE